MSEMSKWGAHGWCFLHSCAWAYPEHPTPADRRVMAAFLVSTGRVLPCLKCRAHYATFVAKHVPNADAPALRDRDALSRCLVQLHNEVNERLGKPTQSYADVRARYTREVPPGWTYTAVLATLVIAVAAAALLLHSRWPR